MIALSDGLAKVTGPMTLATATVLFAEGVAALSDSPKGFDLSGVSDVDSSGLAVVFGWLREAKRLNKTVNIVNLPGNLTSLAEVYGVSDLLPA